MSNYFKYSILTYNHSQLLNEKINVGILFYFPNSQGEKIFFKYPKKLNRLKAFYTDFSEWQLKSYLSAIEIKTNKLNLRYSNGSLNLHHDEELKDIIYNEYIKDDATVLQFSDIKKGKLYDNIENVITQFYNLFFSIYDDIKDNRERHDEIYILLSLRQIFRKKNDEVFHKLSTNKIIQNETTSCKFDFGYVNGVENLIKPLGFDYIDPHKINYKAIQWQAVFEKLFTNGNNYRLNLLVSKPQNGNPSETFKEYDKALKILDETKVDKSIEEETDFEKYVDDVIEKITLHPESPETGNELNP